MIAPASPTRSDCDSALLAHSARTDLTDARERSRRRPTSRQTTPPVSTSTVVSPPYACPSAFATQDVDAETAVMMEEKVTTTNPGGTMPDATMMEGVERPPAVADAQPADPAQSDAVDAKQPTPAPAAEGASEHLPAISTQGEAEAEAAKEDSSGGAQTQAPDEKQTALSDVTKPDDSVLSAETPADNQPTGQIDPLPATVQTTEENNVITDVGNLPDPFVSAPQDLSGEPAPSGVLMEAPNLQDYYGSMDVEPPNSLAIPPDMLDTVYPLSSHSGLQVEDSRQCAFAKLEFPDGDFYMTTYAVELGRDARAFRQEMRRRNQEELQEQQVAGSVGEGPQTPMRPTAPSVASVCRSNLSECGGIMGGDDYHVNVAPLKRKKKKKESKSTSSSSQRPSRKSSIADSNAFEPIDYNGLVFQSQPDTSSFLPDPYEVPLVPIHPPMSESGPVGHKGISRKHLKIYYSFDNQVFEMKVLGRNGAFLNEVHYMPENDAVELHDGDKIQIGAVSIMFRLPNASADDDVRSEGSDSISGGISLNFEDGRGQSIVADEESDDDGFSYAEQYGFSPHAYGWDSEEEEFSADDDPEDEYREHERLPKVKLKLKLKQPAQQATAKGSKAEARLKKKKKKEKFKAKQEAKAKLIGKTTPKAQNVNQSEEAPREKNREKDKEKEKEKDKEKEKEKEKKEKKEKTASKIASKTASKAPSKTVDKPKEKSEATSQVNIVPPEDVPQPSTEIPQHEIKTEGGKEKEEKKAEQQTNKDSSGRRVLTAEEAEKLGLEPGTIIERKKGPGRPPKDGIMSKREKAEIMRRKKEAEKARKLGLDPESITKVDLTRPREKKDGEGKADKKPKSEGAEGESAGPDGEGQGAEKKSVKMSRPLRTPSPEMKESDYTEEQLQRPAANYVVLIHEAISNSKEGKLNLQQIYSAIERKYPYYKFKTGTTGWQSSVRHNLGQHDAFRKAEKEGKGWLWAINPGVSIEKERRKRVTPPPQPQARPYYPPSHQSPYGMPHAAANYQHPPGPYPPRPPAAPGQPPYAAAQPRTYQSPYGSQPLGQAAQPVQHRPPYGPPNGARPSYPSPYGASPYGAPAAAPSMSYPPNSASSSHPPSATSYATASPSPYPTSGAPAYSPPANGPGYPPRPPQAQLGQPGMPQTQQHPGQHSVMPTPVSVNHPSNEPIPPRKPNLYLDSAPYAPMLNNFRDYYIRNAHAMLKRKLTRDEIVKLTDRGLERALFPERYLSKEEELDESARLDLKDEKDIEEAVKGMLKKFNYGYLVEEAERRVGRAPAPPPVSSGPTQINGSATSQAPAPTPSQPTTGQLSAGQAAQGQNEASGSTVSQPTTTQTSHQNSEPSQVHQPAPLSSQMQGATPGAASGAVPTPSMTSSKIQDDQPTTASSNQSTSQSAPATSTTSPTNPSQAPPSTSITPSNAPPAPSPTSQPTQNPVPVSAQAVPPRANGTSTPVPPPVEALTPVGGSPKPGTPVSATASAPGSVSFSGKRPSSAPGNNPTAGVKRSLDGDPAGEHDSEAKKPKVEE